MNERYLIPEIPIISTRTPVQYQIGLFLCAVVMILLPIIYLALIALTGYGTYFYATNVYFLDDVRPGWLALLLYLTPIISGIILLYYMIKPLFLRSGITMQGINLKPEEGESFIQLVNELCQLIRAPVPTEIVLNCDVNASASFRKGIIGIIKNELHLTVGIPLIYTLNIRQLSGVLAHELGHFSQGAGMRLSYIVRSINYWFFKTVAEGDRLRASLADKTSKVDIRIALILVISRFFITISQMIIHKLMQAGHLVSSYLLRQMEYDADYYEIQIAGTQSFIETSEIISLAAHAQLVSNQYLDLTYEKSQLPLDYNEYIFTKYKNLPAKVKKEMLEESKKLTTEKFDTHPSWNDRIEVAKELNMKGVIQNNHEAQTLFHNFDRLSKEITLKMYQQNPDFKTESVSLIQTDQYDQIAATQSDQDKSLSRFWGGYLYSLIYLDIIIEFDLDITDLNNSIKNQQDYSKSLLKKCVKFYPEFILMKENILETKMELEFCDIKDLRIQIFAEKKAHFNSQLKKLKNQYDIYFTQLDNFVKNQNLRLNTILSDLINSPGLQSEAPFSISELKESKELLDNLKIPYKMAENLQILLQKLAKVNDISDASNSDKEKFIKLHIEKIYDTLKSLRKKCPESKYPYNSPDENLTIRDFITTEIPDLVEFENILDYTAGVIQNVFYLFGRILIPFTYTLEYVESSHNLQIIDISEIENKELDNQLPILFSCPECMAELELDRSERKSRKFTCPNCETFQEIENIPQR